MKRMHVAVIAVGAGIAMLGGVAAVQAARKAATTKAERAQMREQRRQRLGTHVRKATKGNRQQRSTDNVFGTITYEPGAPADSFLSEPGGNNNIANRFNSAMGGPLRAGNLTGVTFFPGNVVNTAVVSVAGPPAGGVAQILAITYLTGIVGNQFNTVTLAPPVPVGPDFLAGLYVGAFGGTDQIGMRNASINGQGFHAHQMNFAGTIMTGVVALPGQNTMFRASGNLLVPVELMDFKLE